MHVTKVSSIANILILRLAPQTICYFFLECVFPCASSLVLLCLFESRAFWRAQGALHNMLCNRLLLNIRGAYESVSMPVSSIIEKRGDTETQVLDTMATLSESNRTFDCSDDIHDTWHSWMYIPGHPQVPPPFVFSSLCVKEETHYISKVAQIADTSTSNVA